MIDLRATAFTGLVLIAVVLGGFFIEIAQGRDGSPFGELAAIAGITYLAAALFVRWRS